MDALIRYVCIDPAHVQSGHVPVGDLTVHDGSWAFCPADEREGHEWKRVREVDVDGLTGFGLHPPAGSRRDS